MDNLIISPSILAADFYNLKPQLESVRGAGVDVLHVDVMDGVFVPNISIGVPVVESLSKSCQMTLDVHLMIVSPEKYIEVFAKAGADWLTVHYEAVSQDKLTQILGDIRRLGLKAGLSIKPDTPVSVLQDFACLCDLVLLMTVPPGFGGQSYGSDSGRRISECRRLLDKLNPGCILSVDGGIDCRTIGGAYRAGARLFVAGSAVFGADCPAKAVDELRRCAVKG